MMKKMIPIIILILVLAGGGVGAYFYFKKKKDAEPSPVMDEDYEEAEYDYEEEEVDVDLDDTDSIISETSMSSDLQTKARNWVNTINKAASNNASGWSWTKIDQSASSSGITQAQQVVVSALWQMYQTSGYITKDQCSKFSNEVKNL